MTDLGITWQAVFDLIATAAVIFGGFFMVLGAVGVTRFPDAYHRLHATSKSTTLGISGLLIAACFALGGAIVVSKSIAVITLTVVANPLGAHLLAKAAHHAKLPKYSGTLSDELAEDKANPDVPTSDDFIGAPGLDGPAENEWATGARPLARGAA